MLSFKKWLEDCGPVVASINTGPYSRAKKKYTADDDEIPWNERGKDGMQPTPPDKLFGGKKKMKKGK